MKATEKILAPLFLNAPQKIRNRRKSPENRLESTDESPVAVHAARVVDAYSKATKVTKSNSVRFGKIRKGSESFGSHVSQSEFARSFAGCIPSSSFLPMNL